MRHPCLFLVKFVNNIGKSLYTDEETVLLVFFSCS